MNIGYRQLGRGPNNILVLHDWVSDCSSYAPCEPYLSLDKFTYIFMDCRGYGRSIDFQGQYTLDEITSDALGLVQSLGWDKFHVIGHSMNGMTVQNIALKAADKVKSLVAITPVPACGENIPSEFMPQLEDAASSNDEFAKYVLHMMTGNRHHDNFINFKVRTWREASRPEARVAYLHMFSGTDFSEQVNGLVTPCLVLIGQYDSESHNRTVMEETFSKWLPNCEIREIENAGHYPMQEAPAYFIGQIEQFLEKHCS